MMMMIHPQPTHQNKIALVTAGTQGIGLAVVETLIAEGASKVIICSRKKENVEAVTNRFNNSSTRGRVVGTTCNASKMSDIEKLAEFVREECAQSHATLDLVVSNVGIDPKAGKALEMEDSLFDKIFDTNVKSAWYLLKLIKPLLSPSSASIVLISSTGAYQPAVPSGLYGASKAALVSLAKALSQELGPRDKIRINVVCPGLVKTRMSEAFWKNGEYAKVAERHIALRRLGEPSEVADLVSFLLSDRAKWITGESFIVSGGTNTRL